MPSLPWTPCPRAIGTVDTVSSWHRNRGHSVLVPSVPWTTCPRAIGTVDTVSSWHRYRGHSVLVTSVSWTSCPCDIGTVRTISQLIIFNRVVLVFSLMEIRRRTFWRWFFEVIFFHMLQLISQCFVVSVNIETSPCTCETNKKYVIVNFCWNDNALILMLCVRYLAVFCQLLLLFMFDVVKKSLIVQKRCHFERRFIYLKCSNCFIALYRSGRDFKCESAWRSLALHVRKSILKMDTNALLLMRLEIFSEWFSGHVCAYK